MFRQLHCQILKCFLKYYPHFKTVKTLINAFCTFLIINFTPIGWRRQWSCETCQKLKSVVLFLKKKIVKLRLGSPLEKIRSVIKKNWRKIAIKKWNIIVTLLFYLRLKFQIYSVKVLLHGIKRNMTASNQNIPVLSLLPPAVYGEQISFCWPWQKNNIWRTLL